MDRHLGFLEIPQPRDQRVEVTRLVVIHAFQFKIPKDLCQRKTLQIFEANDWLWKRLDI